MIGHRLTTARPAPAPTPAALAEHRETLAAALEEGRALLAEGDALFAGSPRDLRRWGDLHAALEDVRHLLERQNSAGPAPEELPAAAQGARRKVDELCAQIDRHRAPLAAARAELARQAGARRALAAEVLASIDPALGEARAAARAASEEAQARAVSARARLDAAERTPPAGAADTPRWARDLGALRDELAGYQLLAEQARGQAERAEQAYAQALGAAWDARERQARADAERAEVEGQGAINAAELALEAARHALQAARRAAMEYLSEVQQARALG